MVGHAVDCKCFVFLVPDYAADVFLKFFPVLRDYEVLPSLDRENYLDIDLRVGIGHGGLLC